MRNLLFGHLEDCSTPQYFCFSVRCEVCGEYWYSSSIPFSKAAQAGSRTGSQGTVQPMSCLPAAGL